MSGRLVGEVLHYAPADLTPLERLVLVALAEAAPDRDRIARYHVGSDDLADKTGTHPSTVKKAMAELVRRGLVVTLIEKPRRGVAQNYRITRLTEATRRAVLRVAPTPPNDDPPPPTNGSRPRHPNGPPWTPPMGTAHDTQTPVDNPANGHQKGSPGPPKKGSHQRYPSRNNHLPVTQVSATQVPAGLSR